MTPWTAAHQAPLSSSISLSLLKLMSIESAMLTISSSVVPFSSCLQSFPASGSFLMSQFFASGGQRIETSASPIPLPSCRLEAGCTGTVPRWTLRYLPELHKRKACGQKTKEFSLKKKNKKQKNNHHPLET